ncbi:hypothetical protein C2845_PM12G06500 [Panicum miliaceum]|uniref:Arf-GAP domain-containing protein n=1 Tax=Panicum miliaceum TaxID=4540 RepID=A0A3L6QKF6_PANMI|nr:hypothetical protein C2845_PM12G06500 [Panicum miliaceum]
MGSRVKEDERHERIIRGLLKLPANKRCINCNNLGPQYVCTNFWTFVCTNCSGAHREFTHRVKSVSMAKFTAQEVTALQEGGNEDDKDEYSENRRSDGNWGGSRSPPNGSYSDRRSYSGRSDDRNSRYSYGDRSPGYEQNDYKKSPRYFEGVDDRSGKTTPVQRFEDRRFSEPRKPDSGSPDFQKEADGSSPVVRPVRDILGDNAPQLRTMSSASSIASSEGTSEPTKVANAVSLIDFSADPEPPAPAAPPQPASTTQQHPVNAMAPQPVHEQGKSPSVSGGDWASFDAFGQQQTPQTSSSANPLESALAQLSFSEAPSARNVSAFPASIDPTLKPNDGGHSSIVDQSHNLFDAPFGISGNQAPTVMSNQGSSVQQSPLAAHTAGLPSQVTANQQGTSGIQGAASTDSKSSGRKELPADIFAALYPTSTPMMPGWQRAPQFGMGYGMQYPAGVPLSGPPGASAGTTPQTLLGTSSFGVPPQQPHQLYQSAAPPSPFMMQQVQNSMPQQPPNSMHAIHHRQQGLGSFNMGFDQQVPPRYPQPGTPPSYGSVAGSNPFG